MKKKEKIRLKELAIILSIFLFVVFVLFIERQGIDKYGIEPVSSYYLTNEQAKTPQEAMKGVGKTTLALYDSKNETSASNINEFKRMFLDMKVGIDYIDLSQQKLPNLSRYQRVVVLTTHLSVLKNQVTDLMDYVRNGGNVLFAMTLQRDEYTSIIEQKLGIVSASYQYSVVDRMVLDKDFMLGSSKELDVEEPFESSWTVSLDSKAKVHMKLKGEAATPLIWSYDYGKGRVVVDNFGLYGKAYRGFYAASYSLLGEVSAYPVINASSFTIDDFPSPVPSGYSEFITRDYKMNIADFYNKVWWPDMLAMAQKYGLKYTGVLIENYGNDTSGSTEPQTDLAHYSYFGNSLLKSGGEIGLHGYNHQPLSPDTVDYGNEFAYHTWSSQSDMKKSFAEMTRFGKSLFPRNQFSVYVPPSNVLSKEGRDMIVKNFSGVRTIASNYFSGPFVYEQEFEVSPDGIIEAPRITASSLEDAFTQITATSELNFHYVSHHFIHPDDTLDVERGAKVGWAKMYEYLNGQMDWLYRSAPEIRNLVESQMGGAIQRFSSVNIQQNVTDKEITFTIGNLIDEAYFMVRINKGKIGKVDGGSMKHLTGNLYLLHAEKSTVTIQR